MIGALAYPAFLAVFGFTIVAVLVTFFVPQFETLFQRLRDKGELPADETTTRPDVRAGVVA